MNDELARIAERNRQQRAARMRALEATRLAHAAGAALSASPHAIGDRVFDTVSGEEVEVVGLTRENVVGAPPER